MCGWQAGQGNCHLAAFIEYRLHLQREKVRKKEAKQEAILQSQCFAEWAMAGLHGRSVYVRYENQLSADGQSQWYEGHVLSVGPYMPPDLLIKFCIVLQPGDGGGVVCPHSMEFKSRAEFDSVVELIQ